MRQNLANQENFSCVGVNKKDWVEMIKLLNSKECLLCRWFNLVHPQNSFENGADDKLYKRICGEVGFGKRWRRRDQMAEDKLNWLFTPGSRRVTYPVLHSILTLCHIYCLFIGPHICIECWIDRQFYGGHTIRRRPALALQSWVNFLPRNLTILL